jgi:hypothetical protein
LCYQITLERVKNEMKCYKYGGGKDLSGIFVVLGGLVEAARYRLGLPRV